MRNAPRRAEAQFREVELGWYARGYRRVQTQARTRGQVVNVEGAVVVPLVEAGWSRSRSTRECG